MVGKEGLQESLELLGGAFFFLVKMLSTIRKGAPHREFMWKTCVAEEDVVGKDALLYHEDAP